ncbi:hypothetical protein ACIGW0_01820 [Streptomyces bikiniensis]|uniref:Uncharacterized protein n=1 Tax=Streptomyces bikiniensis TaxID=1896 RepID=A0ABW8CKS1_STRBI
MSFMAFFDGATTPWRADPAVLTSAIRDRWDEVEVDPRHRSEVCAYSWAFRAGEGLVDVFFAEDGTGLYVDATLPDAAEVACLLRRFVPEDVALVFCDQGYSFDVWISPGSTVADLIRAANAQA